MSRALRAQRLRDKQRVWYYIGMKSIRRQTLAFLVIFSVIVFVCGGLLHEIIPHDHHAAALWEAIHAVLAHEDKKLLYALFIAAFLFVNRLSFNAAPSLLQCTEPLSKEEKNPLVVPLSRGILSYRTFG